MMAIARAVVVVVPLQAGTIEIDVLGRPAFGYLLENLRRLKDAEICIVTATGARTCCEGLPDVTTRSMAELHGLDFANRTVLLIDSRVWFSCDALTRLFARVEQTGNGARVVARRRGVAGADGEADTIAAICIPPRRDRSGLFRPLQAGSVTGLEQMVHSAVYAQASRCEPEELDAEAPPLEISDFAGIAKLERRLLRDRAVFAMRQGVRMRDPETVYIRGELACGANVEIEVNVILEGRVVLGNGVRIGANSLVRSSTIGERTRVNPFSIIEDSTIGCGSFVGPYGRIRPGSSIGDEVQIGNYVEIKTSQIGARSRINHHSFIGDAVLGERVTIGAGTITCNHDGVGTNQTIIEPGVYVGSGCYLIAPLRIGENATVGAGSTISRDVPARKLTLARSPQTTVDDWRGPRTRRTKK